MRAEGVTQYFRALSGVSPWSQTGQTSLPRTEEEALRGVTREFEAIFIGEMLKQMRRPDFSGGLLGNDRASKMYREMHDEAMAAEMARAGGLGIGDMLYQELRRGI